MVKKSENLEKVAPKKLEAKEKKVKVTVDPELGDSETIATITTVKRKRLGNGGNN